MNFTKIKSIKKTQSKDVYNLTVEKNHNFFANNLCLHNCGYTGQIKLRYRYLFQPSDLIQLLDGSPFFITVNENKIYKIGDKIAQLVPYKNIDIDFELVDSLDETERNTGGFGSTGK